MGQFLVTGRINQLEEHLQLCGDFGVALEINDFFEPGLLDDKDGLIRVMEEYRNAGIPEGSTMHGVFFDISIASRDEKIRVLSEERMTGSMEIARALGLKAVIFHVNYNSMLESEGFDKVFVDKTVAFLKQLLIKYEEIEIYVENMFEADPHILVAIARELSEYKNFGICFDWAHGVVFGGGVKRWVQELSTYIRHIHINDNDLKSDLHWAVGQGSIDWNEFADYYCRYFSDCSVLVETETVQCQRESLGFLRSLGVLV